MEIDSRNFLVKLDGNDRELQLDKLFKAFCNRQMSKIVQNVDYVNLTESWFRNWRDRHVKTAMNSIRQR